MLTGHIRAVFTARQSISSKPTYIVLLSTVTVLRTCYLTKTITAKMLSLRNRISIKIDIPVIACFSPFAGTETKFNDGFQSPMCI